MRAADEVDTTVDADTAGDSGGTTQQADRQVLLEIRALVKSYGTSRKGARVTGVGGVSFDIYDGEFFTLLGPSGCGKTTTLRSVAGLEHPDSGEILVDNRPLFSSSSGVNVPVNKRGIGMVFQSYAIWPHMSVFDNVAFPLQVGKRSARPSKAELAERVRAALVTVQLDALGDRRATDLSGGQQQRLALARALVARPRLMLLDEPLSNLDAKLRDSMRAELKRLQRELRFTSMYVTHDQVEALALSSRIAIMNGGQIQQIGRPRDIYQNPANQFVADFIGRSNFLEGTIASADSGTYQVRSDIGALTATGAEGRAAGERAMLAIRPEHVTIVDDASGGGTAPEGGNSNEIKGVVETRQFLGECVEYVIDIDGRQVIARTNPSLSVAPRTTVRVRLPHEHCRLLPANIG